MKKAILAANTGKPMPPIYHLLTRNCTNVQESGPVFHELPDELNENDIRLAHSCVVEVNSEPQLQPVENVSKLILSPSKENPLSLQDIRKRADAILNKIYISEDGIDTIELETRAQTNSDEWHYQRLPRITASKCKRALLKEKTSPRKALEEILGYKKRIQTAQMKDGIDSEPQIIEMYSNEKQVQVAKCGFVISKTHPFLGASPDGLVGECGTLEIKKIHPHDGESLEQALRRQHVIKQTEAGLIINNNHSYYYQMQQQLFCTERKWTDFVASDGKSLFVRRVKYCKEFWTQHLPKLEKFFHDIILLELAYPRVKHGLDRIGKFGISYGSLPTPRKV